MFTILKEVFCRDEEVRHGEVSVFRDKEKVVGNTSLEFSMTKMLFAAAKRFATTKTAIHRIEERTYVSILVLSQTRFLSHSSPA